jgi:hypothetical protein
MDAWVKVSAEWNSGTVSGTTSRRGGIGAPGRATGGRRAARVGTRYPVLNDTWPAVRVRCATVTKTRLPHGRYSTTISTRRLLSDRAGARYSGAPPACASAAAGGGNAALSGVGADLAARTKELKKIQCQPGADLTSLGAERRASRQARAIGGDQITAASSPDQPTRRLHSPRRLASLFLGLSPRIDPIQCRCQKMT